MSLQVLPMSRFSSPRNLQGLMWRILHLLRLQHPVLHLLRLRGAAASADSGVSPPMTTFPSFNRRTLLCLHVSAMDKTASEVGGYRGSRALQLAVPINSRGRERQEKWLYLRQVLVATLGVGQSAWFHCMSGVHHGPILCAAAVAFVQRLAFWKVYENIETLRVVDRGAVLNRRGGADIFSWAEGIAAAPTEPLKLHLPVQWVASARRNATSGTLHLHVL